MSDPDLSILFPSEALAPAASQNAATAPTAPTAASIIFGDDRHAPAPAQRPADDAAQVMFPTSEAPDPAAAVAETLTHLVHDKTDPAAVKEMAEVSNALAEDFRSAGMDAAAVSEIMNLAKNGSGNTMFGQPVSAERIAGMNARAEDWIRENAVSESDLALAKRLIGEIDQRAGGKVKKYLNDTGAGSDPKMIAAVLREAKRRYGEKG